MKKIILNDIDAIKLDKDVIYNGNSLRNLFGSYSKYDNTNKFIVKNNTNIISNDKNSVLASDFLSLDDKSRSEEHTSELQSH